MGLVSHTYRLGLARRIEPSVETFHMPDPRWTEVILNKTTDESRETLVDLRKYSTTILKTSWASASIMVVDNSFLCICQKSVL